MKSQLYTLAASLLLAFGFTAQLAAQCNGILAVPLNGSVTGLPLSLNSSVVQAASCSGTPNGSINLTIVGGNPSYSFVWDDGSTDQDRTNLASGLYEVTVSDALNCSSIYSFTVPGNGGTPTLSVTSASDCPTDNGGRYYDLSASGGLPAYSFNVSALNGGWFTDLGNDTYEFQAGFDFAIDVLDAQNCGSSQTLSIPAILMDTISNTACNTCVLSDGLGLYTFFNLGNDYIAAVTDALNGVDLSSTEVCVTVEPTLVAAFGENYMQRHWLVTPVVNSPACLKFYFTDDELTTLRLADGLPDNLTAIANLHVAQFSGAGESPFSFVTNNDYSGAQINVVANDPQVGVWSVSVCVPSHSGYYLYIPNNWVGLPVELLDLEGWREGSVNRLRWATSSEYNSDYFNIERSADGINFETIGQADAAGMSNVARYYDYIDAAPLEGINYYRLRMVDFDQSFKYSNVVAITNEISREYSFYPNPTQTDINYEFYSAGNETIRVELIDALGRIVNRYDQDAVIGRNRFVVMMNDLSAGTYIIRATHTVTGFQRSFKAVKID